MNTPKLQLYTEKDLKTSTKDFPQLKIKGKSPLRWVREAEMVSGQDP